MELLENSRAQVVYLDSALQATEGINKNLNDQLYLSQANYELADMRQQNSYKQLGQLQKDLNKQQRHTRTWRTFFFIAGGLFAGYAAYHNIR